MDNELNIQCDSCSATLKFKPGTDSLSCSYCGKTHQIIPSETKHNGIQSFDIDDYVRGVFDNESQVELSIVECNVCSAEITLGEKLISKDCPFCSTPLVIQKSKVNRMHKPQYMLPFAISENESERVFKDWIKKRWFAPNALKKYAVQNKKLQGVYLPFWLYDCTATSYYEGKRGTVYPGSMGNSQKTKIKWDRVRGTVHDIFDAVLVPATRSLPNRKLDALEPWDLEYLKPFDSRYLTGFKTEMYQVSLRDGFSDAKQKMSRIIRRHIKRDIGAEQQQISHVSTLYENTTFKHILLPCWLSAYRYRGKTYQFVVNARTAEVQGEHPFSIVKISLVILCVVLSAYVLFTIDWIALRNQIAGLRN